MKRKLVLTWTCNREQGTALLIVPHDPRLAARCDRVIEPINGHVAAR